MWEGRRALPFEEEPEYAPRAPVQIGLNVLTDFRCSTKHDS
jgi:hypothetical protein